MQLEWSPVSLQTQVDHEKSELIREGGGEIRGEDACMTEISRAGAASDLQAVISAAHTAAPEHKFLLNLPARHLGMKPSGFFLAAVMCEPLRWSRAYVYEEMRMWEMEIKSGEAIVCACALWYTVAQGRWIQLFKHLPWLSSCNCLSKQTRTGALPKKMRWTVPVNKTDSLTEI